jgi:hypothetical protein
MGRFTDALIKDGGHQGEGHFFRIPAWHLHAPQGRKKHSKT